LKDRGGGTGNYLLGLLGTNPEGWRLKELVAALARSGVPHMPLSPWLFAAEIRDGSVEYSYDRSRVTGPDADLVLDVIHVISLGFEELPEALYKLRLLKELADGGSLVVNSIETIETCRNKVDQTLRLTSRGVKMPATMVTESVHTAVEYIKANAPCVLKPITGLQGRGLILIPDDMGVGVVTDYVAWFQAKHGKDVIYIQQFIEHPQYDIRVLVVGGEVVSKMRRFNPESWRTNIAAGARPLPSDDPVDDIALEAAESVGGEIVGVDVLPSKDGEYFVLEVNAFPGWKGLQEVTDVNIGEEIAGYLSSLA
jgi:ribosomal protein S6--L-glutamate ligase